MIMTRLERMVRKMKIDLTGDHCQYHFKFSMHSTSLLQCVLPKSKEVGEESS